jgi:acyl-CoA synthetase
MTNTMLTTLSAARLRAFYEAGYWQDKTIYDLVRTHAGQHPDRIAIRERTRAVSYVDLIGAADRLAGAFADAGLRRGQRVAVWLPSRIETAVAFLACSRSGYVSCPSLHRAHTVGEITNLLQRMDAAALVAEEGYGADADRRSIIDEAKSVESLRLIVPLPPVTDEDDNRLLASLPAGKPTAQRTDPNTVVYLAFTSGSSGRPKGVMHSDNTVMAPVRALARDWSLSDDMVVYSMSPLSHNLGFGAMILALTGGGELVVHDVKKGDSLTDRLRETGATFMFGVPTHAIDLLAELEDRPEARPTTVRGFRISGAPVPPYVAEALLEHGMTPQSGYGMTEAGSHHYTSPTDTAEMIVSSSGRPCAGHETKVFSQSDPDVEMPPGEIGQIGARGAALMLGYFDDQRLTEGSFNGDGWFLSGDLGWVDESGYIRVTGRKKDLIIRGGHNIFPATIENLAVRHPAVDHAAAIPIPDERLGEKVCLVVTVRDGSVIDPMDVLEHLAAAGLSKYDMPEYFATVAEMPLLPSGKILKRQLLDLASAGELHPDPVHFTPSS